MGSLGFIPEGRAAPSSKVPGKLQVAGGCGALCAPFWAKPVHIQSRRLQVVAVWSPFRALLLCPPSRLAAVLADFGVPSCVPPQPPGAVLADFGVPSSTGTTPATHEKPLNQIEAGGKAILSLPISPDGW